MKIGIDIGGTFTDFVVQDEPAGEIRSFKLPSTPNAPEQAVLLGLERLRPGPDTLIVHGSTVATNAILERKGARTAFITSEGFRDLLTIGRQNRRELYDFFADRPEPLVPPDLCFEVRERVDYRGKVLIALEEGAERRLIQELEEGGVESVAICLLFSFLHPQHESRLAGALREAGFSVSASSDVLAEFREYERASTTALNAYVMPAMDGYLGRLETEIRPNKLRVMQSNGGSLSAGQAREQPARAVLSGPAGGVIGALHIARSAGIRNVITFDMGGTSTDVSLAEGDPRQTSEGEIDGLPLRTPMIEIHTVGSGGGSIARLDIGGSLQVGPESAGSSPGPACYGLGGREPTVTDANLVLGRLDPKRYLGGEMKLSGDVAFAVLERLGEQLGVTAVSAALGIVRVANANMARAIRLISTERGHDPRDFLLISFGGAGGLHACEVARAVGIRRALVPSRASTLSAYGMLVADVTRDYVQTVMLSGNASLDAIEEPLQALVSQGKKDLDREGILLTQMTLIRELDLRYIGQSYELTLPFQADYQRAFHAAHQVAYGYSDAQLRIEVVNVRVRAIGHVTKPEIATEDLGVENPSAALLERREVRLDQSTSPKLPVYDGDQLLPGNRLEGPALVLYPDTTLFLGETEFASMDRFRNLIVAVGAQ